MPEMDDRTAYPLDSPEALALAQLTSGIVNVQTGTSYVLQLSDWRNDVEMSSSDLNTVEVPADLPDGFWCTVVQAGAGQTTIAAGSGSTILTYSSQFKLAGQGADCLVRRRATAGQYRISGNLVP